MKIKMNNIKRMYELQKETLLTKLKNKISFFNEHSSLKVFGNVISISETPLFKRIFWSVTLACCCYGSAAVLKESLSIYRQDAVSYTVETDYLEWDTPFPAITLCESFNNMNLKNRLFDNNIPLSMTKFYKDILYWNNKVCKSCMTCKINLNCADDYVSVIDIIRARCDQMLIECWWNGEPFTCCDWFKPIETEFGLCYAFNSRLAGESDIKTVNRKLELPVLEFTTDNTIALRVHSPDDMTSSTAENVVGQKCSNVYPITNMSVDIKVEQTTSDVSVRAIAKASRDCLFDEEVPDFIQNWPFSQYSYNGCVWYCRALAQIQYCNCTHQFMPKIESYSICDIQGLRCLSKNSDMLEIAKCECPMSCEGLEYKATYTSCRRSDSPSDDKASAISYGKVRFSQFPTLRVRRQAIRDMLGLVVDFGGVIGVFFGASLLSFIEIIYIICFR